MVARADGAILWLRSRWDEGLASDDVVTKRRTEGAHAAMVNIENEKLDEGLLKEGRMEEVKYMVKKLDMFEFVDTEEVRRRSGKDPMSTRWVDG